MAHGLSRGSARAGVRAGRGPIGEIFTRYRITRARHMMMMMMMVMMMMVLMMTTTMMMMMMRTMQTCTRSVRAFGRALGPRRTGKGLIQDLQYLYIVGSDD